MITFSDGIPNRLFTVIKSWIDKTSGVALDLGTAVPSYHVEDGSSTPARRLVRHSFSEGGRPAAPEVRLRRAYGVTSFAGGGRKAELIY